MVALYVFSLILGGGFLALSVFGDLFGGHGDVDFGGDVGGLDGDLGLDAGHLDVDGGSLDLGGGHVDVNTVHTELQADSAHLASKVFSIRTLFYSLFGFGSVGTLLTFVWSGNPFLTGAFAVASGVASGSLINVAFSYVKRTESGTLQSEATYSGLRGKVTLPLRFGVPGKIVVERGGRRLELRALPHASAAEQGDPATWKAVMVVEMEHGVAKVAPVEDLLLEP